MTESPIPAAELSRIRQLFPHTETGHIYLNHAAISPLSLPLTNAIEAFLRDRQSGAVENFEMGMEIMASARNRAAGYIDLPADDHITFFGNTSDAISAVAEGFPWKDGDEVLLNSMEFPSNVQPFRALSRLGVNVVIAQSKENRITAEMLEKEITPRTRMISISAVQFLTGFRADLEEIGELCRAHDLFFVVDAIQQLGAMPVKPLEAGIDAVATGSHKWLMGPMGSGFLWMSDRLADLLRPARTGWLSVEEPWELMNYDQKWQPVSSHLETGTPNMLSITGLDASLKLLMETGEETIRNQILYLSGHASRRLESEGASLISPAADSERAGIVTFRLPQAGDAEEAVNRLREMKITLSMREGMIRISPHFYNTKEEIDIAIDALLKRR